MKCMQILFLFVMLPFSKHGEQKYIALGIFYTWEYGHAYLQGKGKHNQWNGCQGVRKLF